MARAEGGIDCFAAFALPEVFFADKMAAESADYILACFARKMCELQGADFTSLYSGRVDWRRFVPCHVLEVWNLCAACVGLDFPYDCRLVYRFRSSGNSGFCDGRRHDFRGRVFSSILFSAACAR